MGNYMRVLRKCILVIIFIVVCKRGLFACKIPQKEVLDSYADSYVITDSAVVDVKTGTVSSNQTVWIHGECIERIGNGNEKELKSASIIQGRDLYLVPGLVDAHVHFLDPETFGP
jgi:adenine deaminase